METPLIITDVTRMRGSRVCVAGINQKREIIRPVLPHGIMEDWLEENGKTIIRPFSRIHLDLLEHQPDPPHTEDWLINERYKVFIGMLEEKYRIRLLNETAVRVVGDIFGTEIIHDQGFFIPRGYGNRSLGTLKPISIERVTHTWYAEKWDYRISFTDHANCHYRLSVTDLSFRYYVDHLREIENNTPEAIGMSLTKKLKNSNVYLRVGLARGWEKFPDRCYLQITGIYTFPDYLEGKCFADFR